MVIGITVLIMLVLLCVIAVCVMLTDSMDYDPAWDEWEKMEKTENGGDKHDH